jgi:hypothetical protein
MGSEGECLSTVESGQLGPANACENPAYFEIYGELYCDGAVRTITATAAASESTSSTMRLPLRLVARLTHLSLL